MQQERNTGALVISLDFELYWGMFDKVGLAEYGDRIIGERTAIPRMLGLFEEYGIHATWAGVGMLMARDKRELVSFLPPPHLRPTYEDPAVSAYNHLETGEVGEDEASDPYHFGPSLVKTIISTPNQEFGNHTFSHYYCIDGHENDPAIFARDLEAHRAVSVTYGITTESIIFPRNQTSEEALRVCEEEGLKAYRGNEDHVLYRPRKDTEQSLLIRAFRLLDHYVNLSGYHTYPFPKIAGSLMNIPSSRFLRPYHKTLALFEGLRMRRIRNAMTHAAEKGEVFHLWWHPHNFGIDQEENFGNLEKLLKHFRKLQDEFGMESLSMKEVAARVSSGPTA